MDTLRLLGFLTLCSCVTVLAAIRIKEIKVPAELQFGKHEWIELDCKYELDTPKERDGLVIQWYFETNDLIFQWILGGDPKPLGIFKDRVDLSYRVNSNADDKYRALKIVNITTDLTGNYTCKVYNYAVEDSRWQTMVVYEPPKVFQFERSENSSLLLCSAIDIFPKPTLNVYSNIVNLTEVTEEEEDYADIDDEDRFDNEVDSAIDEVEDANGLYNVTKSFRYDPSEITEQTEFICELTIPNTNYRKMLRTFVMPDGETTSTTETYDYETTTMTTTTNSPVPENFASMQRSSKSLLSIIALTYLWRHL